MNNQKAKWNLIDTLISLLLILAIVAVIFLFTPGLGKEKDSEDVSLIYQVEIQNLLPEIAAQLKNQVTVFDANSGVNLGTLLEVTTQAAIYTIAGEDGLTISQPHPELLTLTLTISATANTYGGFYTVSGQPIRIGERLSIKTADFTGIGHCKSLGTEQPDVVS